MSEREWADATFFTLVHDVLASSGSANCIPA